MAEPYRQLAAAVIQAAVTDLYSRDATVRYKAQRFLFFRTDAITRLWFDLAGVDLRLMRESAFARRMRSHDRPQRGLAPNVLQRALRCVPRPASSAMAQAS